MHVLALFLRYPSLSTFLHGAKGGNFYVMGDTAQSRSSPNRGWLRRSLPATTYFCNIASSSKRNGNTVSDTRSRTPGLGHAVSDTRSRTHGLGLTASHTRSRTGLQCYRIRVTRLVGGRQLLGSGVHGGGACSATFISCLHVYVLDVVFCTSTEGGPGRAPSSCPR